MNDSQQDWADKEWLYNHEERTRVGNLIEDIAVCLAVAMAITSPFALWFTGAI